MIKYTCKKILLNDPVAGICITKNSLLTQIIGFSTRKVKTVSKDN